MGLPASPRIVTSCPGWAGLPVSAGSAEGAAVGGGGGAAAADGGGEGGGEGDGELGPLCGTHFWGADPFLRGDVRVGRICGWRRDGGGLI